MKYAIIGEYPDENVDESFRSDVKVLVDGISSLPEAKRELAHLAIEHYTLLQIWEYRTL